MVAPAAAEDGRRPIYFQDPDGKPSYSLTPRKTPDGRDYRAVPAGADVSFDEDAAEAAVGVGVAGRRAQDQILPQSDGASGHVADAEEGLHGDGLHRGLRRRRYRRRLRQAVAGQDPAHRREIRAGGAARDPDDGARAGHHPTRRTAGFRHLDEVRKLRPESRQRHDGLARRQRPALDGGLQPRGDVRGRRVPRHHHIQDDQRRRIVRPGIPAEADKPRRAGGSDCGNRKKPERSDLDRVDRSARRHRSGAQRDRGHARPAGRRALQDRRPFGDVGVDRRRRTRSRHDLQRSTGHREGPELSRARVLGEGRGHLSRDQQGDADGAHPRRTAESRPGAASRHVRRRAKSKPAAASRS